MVKPFCVLFVQFAINGFVPPAYLPAHLQVQRRTCAASCIIEGANQTQVKHMKVLNAQGQVLLSHVKWCDTFGTKLRGLMFRRTLPTDEGLVLAENRSSIAATSIHMFFVPFDIAAIWLDEDFGVVHTVLAKSWRPYYAAPKPARYVLEGPPSLLDQVKLGDRVKFEE